ncbi:MAG: YdcF family protein [Patescibacteria group bacterium]
MQRIASLKKWIGRLCILGGVLLLATTLGISLFGFTEALPTAADVIVVFGNTVNEDGTLSPRLQARMDRGIELYNQGNGKVLFVSGGIGREGVDEADAMKRYALQKGVPADAIVQDSLGVTTHATTENLSLLFSEKDYRSAILVSQFFHLARASLSCKNVNIPECGRSYARYHEWRDIYATIREVPAFLSYLLQGK